MINAAADSVDGKMKQIQWFDKKIIPSPIDWKFQLEYQEPREDSRRVKCLEYKDNCDKHIADCQKKIIKEMLDTHTVGLEECTEFLQDTFIKKIIQFSSSYASFARSKGYLKDPSIETIEPSITGYRSVEIYLMQCSDERLGEFLESEQPKKYLKTS